MVWCWICACCFMRKFNKKATKRRMDALWSNLVRLRDTHCLVCGTTENLQAHHAIVTKAHSNATRWDTRNGVTLCYRCHICKLHGSSDKVFLQEYLEKLNEKISQETQDDIRIKSNGIVKDSQANLKMIEDSLQDML